MAWMNMLYKTYEANAGMAGLPVEGVPLSPVAHMTANAQLEIHLDQNGRLMGAVPVDKENSKTIIPVTEASASRSSGTAPHALCDTLSYIAGDFELYAPDGKSAEKFEKYIAALESWALSPYTHPKVQAVFAYASKRNMIGDLIASGILKCTADGKLADEKISGTPYEKVLVRFRVLDDPPEAVWQDKSLFDCYTRYYVSSQSGDKDICYLTGREETVSSNHPKGIIAANYGAKLISANDTANFTFRGRFTQAEEASAVGYEGTQKAHSALTWLAARQGVTAGTQDKRTYICWNPHGKKVADIENPLGFEEDEEVRSYTEEAYKKRLSKALSGFRGELDDNDDIVVIGLDAATTGRLSVTYYNELKGSDFYDRLEYWGGTCRWYFTKFTPDGRPERVVWSPLIKQIVHCAFGTERGAFLETGDKLMKEQSQRLYHCMLDKRPIPRDIMHALAIRASTPLAYTRGNHERILSTACALILKYHMDQKELQNVQEGVKIGMELDYGNTDRSYLFGRLLAVLEKAERSTYTDETREPNAIRLQNAFVNHPLSTWGILETALNPYFQRMSHGSNAYYKNLIGEITGKLADLEPAALNRPLEEMYLIGYYLQRAELNKPRDKAGNNEEDETV